MKAFPEISGTSSILDQQANQKVQFLQNSYPTASHCICTCTCICISPTDFLLKIENLTHQHRQHRQHRQPRQPRQHHHNLSFFQLKGRYFNISQSIKTLLRDRRRYNNHLPILLQIILLVLILILVIKKGFEDLQGKKELGEKEDRYLLLSKLAANNPAANYQRRRTHQAYQTLYLHPP